MYRAGLLGKRWFSWYTGHPAFVLCLSCCFLCGPQLPPPEAEGASVSNGIVTMPPWLWAAPRGLVTWGRMSPDWADMIVDARGAVPSSCRRDSQVNRLQCGLPKGARGTASFSCLFSSRVMHPIDLLGPLSLDIWPRPGRPCSYRNSASSGAREAPAGGTATPSGRVSHPATEQPIGGVARWRRGS